MSRALLRALALTLAVVAFGQAHVTQAYEGISVMLQQPTGVEVLRAYVDPGAAGFIIVSVLGFISAIGYTLRSYIGRLKRMILSGSRARSQDEGVGGAEQPPGR